MYRNPRRTSLPCAGILKLNHQVALNDKGCSMIVRASMLGSARRYLGDALYRASRQECLKSSNVFFRATGLRMNSGAGGQLCKACGLHKKQLLFGKKVQECHQFTYVWGPGTVDDGNAT